MINLYNCDCIDFMKSMQSESVDLIVTDPPYKIDSYGTSKLGNGSMFQKEIVKKGQVFENNCVEIEDYAKELYRILKPESHCYVMTNNFNIIKFLNALVGAGFHFTKNIIWNKCRKTITPIYMQQYEYCILVTKGKFKKVNDCSFGDIISVPNVKPKGADGKNLHDTPKPVKLMEILVTQSSKEGETVFDPFMGIGSTGIACAKHGRNFIGCEIDEKYFQIARDRIEQEENTLTLF